jgi:hypothetical protein
MSNDARTREPEPPTEWLDALDDLIDESLDREEAIRLTAEELDVDVPLTFGRDAPTAQWRFDGDLTVRVEGLRASLAEWFALTGEPLPRRDRDRE